MHWFPILAVRPARQRNEAMVAIVPFPQDDKGQSGGGSRARLGDLLCARGVLNDEQLRLALHEQKHNHDLLGRVLIKLRFVHERDVLQALSTQTGHAPLRLADIMPSPDMMELWPQEQCLSMMAVPVAFEDNVLSVALCDPFDVRALDQIRRLLPQNTILRLFLAAETDMQAYIQRHYAAAQGVGFWLRELEQQSLSSATAKDQPVIQTVDALLQQAVEAGASDIHLEPESQSVRVRLRVDGILSTLTLMHRTHWPMIAQRLKIMAGMDIVDTRAIQDGRFNLNLQGQEIDFRVSILPTQNGENIVVRVLDQSHALLPLEKLGFSAPQQALLRRLALKPEGMMIITGPTGSGKTTTLYALLQTLNSDARNVMTLEDPVEYQLGGIRQTQVREAFGLGFADGVRAILRQDPDVVLIGEIRDPETAQMGLRAAMTGSRVLTTLHTQDCFGVFPRLREFGISPGLMAGNIVATLAQRLVRRLCSECRQLSAATEEECSLLGVDAKAPPVIGHVRGCAACGHTGYSGRTVISEILPVDAELNELIAQGATRSQMQRAASQKGFVTLAEEGMARLQKGKVSLESLMARVDIPTRMKEV